MLGGIRFGVVTPTEGAAVVAAVYALVVGMFVYRELKIADLYSVLLTAAKTSCAVMFLVAAATVSAWLITRKPTSPPNCPVILDPFMGNQTVLLIIIMVLVLVVGTALDFTPTVLDPDAGLDADCLQVQELIPFISVFCSSSTTPSGLITPPVGIVLNVVCGVGRPADEFGDQGRLAVPYSPDHCDVPACPVSETCDRPARHSERTLKFCRKIQGGSHEENGAMLMIAAGVAFFANVRGEC